MIISLCSSTRVRPVAHLTTWVACLAIGLMPGCDRAKEDTGTDEPPALERPAFLADPSTPFPKTIADLGFFPEAPDLSRLPAGLTGYTPAYPLYSNGTAKHRAIALPEGAAVDITGGGWQFPVGTILIKTFGFEDARADGGQRILETRLMRRNAQGWEYALYEWNEEGTDGTLLDMERARVVKHTAADGTVFKHVLPTRRDCRTCHMASTHAILGFSELQLNTDREGRNQLESLSSAGVLHGKLPAKPAVIAHEDPEVEWLMGYVEGNCVACHHGQSVPLAFDMRGDTLVEQLVGQPTEGRTGNVGIRVVPGSPDESILVRVMRNENLIGLGLNPMPPVGIIQPDTEAIARIEAWIESHR